MKSEKNYSKKKIRIHGHNMAYVDEGAGDPIVLIHGNPTSSYIWRNIIPHLENLGRVIAPDLIGMGDSDKLENSGPESYRLVEHRRYLDAFLHQVGIDRNVIFVLHDWGATLGFDWAFRNQKSVNGFIYMEAIVQNLTWDDWPEEGREFFKNLRSPAGEEMILERNLFVERVLPAAIIRNLTYAEMAEYRRPYLRPGEDRRPTLTWPREIPIHGEPLDVAEIVHNYSKWLEFTKIPKLFINAEPGMILVRGQREYCRSWKNQKEVTVKGLHFIQEDCPDEIGEAAADFIKSISVS